MTPNDFPRSTRARCCQCGLSWKLHAADFDENDEIFCPMCATKFTSVSWGMFDKAFCELDGESIWTRQNRLNTEMKESKCSETLPETSTTAMMKSDHCSSPAMVCGTFVEKLS